MNSIENKTNHQQLHIDHSWQKPAKLHVLNFSDKVKTQTIKIFDWMNVYYTIKYERYYLQIQTIK